MECGVAGGGSTALIASVIRRYSKSARRVYACDSYEGMPEPSEHDRAENQDAQSTGWGTGTCAAPEDSVKAIAAECGVSDLVQVVKGYFEDSFPGIQNSIASVGFLHIDCDWYESTLTVLRTFYDKLSPGALVQVDDYGYWEGMQKAVETFQRERSIQIPLQPLDGAAWFQHS